MSREACIDTRSRARRAATETARATGFEFAGLITCHAEDDFESGAAVHWATEGSWGVTPISASGTYELHRQPGRDLHGLPDGRVRLQEQRDRHVRRAGKAAAGSTLEWDQICATRGQFDYGIVEISADKGPWTELARYDMGDDPAWSTGVADPSSYRHATLDLSAYAYQIVQVRFRLESDTNLEFDGWYLDNVQINDATCTPVVVAVLPPGTATALRLMPPFPNPSRGATRFAFDLPRKEDRVEFKVFDRRVASCGPSRSGAPAWQPRVGVERVRTATAVTSAPACTSSGSSAGAGR